ncbi:DUF4148 domain-containing protein [Paraburkholderia sp. A2WS-5]|uniref:DUF4148 domain-containing protein n=1 Tax=unclassified Paraburkholderia TaxID=2615204 RepID=UPI003B78480A
MNATTRTLAILLAIATPAISFAQPTGGPVTRAQVRAELVQFEHAGYKPGKVHYPADVQAAEARVSARDAHGGSANSGYGGMAVGVSQSGQRVSTDNWRAMYGYPGK